MSLIKTAEEIMREIAAGLKEEKLRDDGIRFMKTLVTPEMAAGWLKERNTHNRTIQKRVVERYARDMAAGRWRYTLQGLWFDPNGKLIDGQHRLAAIVKSETAIHLCVYENVPADMMLGADQGLTRRGHALAQVFDHGGAMTRRHFECANAMLRGGSTANAKAFTPQEHFEFVREHFDAIDWSLTNYRTGKAGLRRASVSACIARAWYHVDLGDLALFCDVLASGITQEDRDVTVIALRDRLQSGKLSGSGQVTSGEVYRRVAWAIGAYVRGAVFGKVQQVKGDAFPLPTINEGPALPYKIVEKH